jgi:hypothetical protein
MAAGVAQLLVGLPFSRELGKSLISRCMKRRIMCRKARDLLREQCFPWSWCSLYHILE